MKLIHCILLASILLIGLLYHAQLIETNTQLDFRYERSSLISHEYWRLITAHFIHLNLFHTLMNLVAFALLTFTFWHNIYGKFDAFNYILCIISIDLGLFILQPELTNYVGFSGILHGLFAYYFIKTLTKKNIVAQIGIVAVIAKILWEQSPWVDTSITAELIGGNIAISAHLYGGIGGLISGLVYKRYEYFRKPCKAII